MVDGNGLRLLQELIDETGRVEKFTDQRTSSIVGTADGKAYLFVFDEGDVMMWTDPDSGIEHYVRPIARAIVDKVEMDDIQFLGYAQRLNGNKLTKSQLLAWGPKRDIIARYNVATLKQPSNIS